MTPLVIEYVLDGHMRGYNFTSNTKGYSDDILKLIWRSAMPRGQGWAAYVGARSLKCFPLGDGRVAVSDVTITAQRDESGRGGIRRAEVQVLDGGSFPAYLNQHLSTISSGGVSGAKEALGFWRRQNILSKAPAPRDKKTQLIFTRAYRDLADWSHVEALMLLLARDYLPKWGRQIAFTTLALTHREEAPVLALPLDKVSGIKDNILVQV